MGDRGPHTAPEGPRAHQPTQRLWLALGAAGLAVLLCLALPWAVSGLSEAEPSYAGQVFPWVGTPTRSAPTEATDARGPGGETAAALRFLGLIVGLFAVYG